MLQWAVDIHQGSQEIWRDDTSMRSTISWRWSLIKFPEGDSCQGQAVLHNSVCPKLSYPNFFAVQAGLLSCVCCLSAFVHFVFTCTVAKKQNGSICKNTVLMETAFHSTSGFHLNPLIGENVTISVLLWKPWREREELLPHITTAKRFIHHHKARTQTLTHARTGACIQVRVQGVFLWTTSTHTYTHTHFFLSETHLAHHDRVISNEVFTTESGF